MDDQRDGNYLWEKIGHSQEIVIKYKKLVNRLKEASVCCKRGGKSSLIKLEIARKEKSMLTILNSESLWIGTDMIQFNAIRDILDREKIKYKYKTYNHLGEWAGSEHFVETLEVWGILHHSPYSMKFLWREKT